MSNTYTIIEYAWWRELQGAQDENRVIRVSLKNGEKFQGRVRLVIDGLVTLDTRWPRRSGSPEYLHVAIGEIATLRIYPWESLPDENS